MPGGGVVAGVRAGPDLQLPQGAQPCPRPFAGCSRPFTGDNLSLQPGGWILVACVRACVRARGGAQAYFVLDELIATGELQESSKNAVLRCVAQQDVLQVRSACSLRF